MNELNVGAVFEGQGYDFSCAWNLHQLFQGRFQNAGLHFHIVGFAGVGAHGHARCHGTGRSVLTNDGRQCCDQDGRNTRFLYRTLNNGRGAVTGPSATGEDNSIDGFLIQFLCDFRAGSVAKGILIAAAAHESVVERRYFFNKSFVGQLS